MSELGRISSVSKLRLKCVDSVEVSSLWSFEIWEEKELLG